MLSKLNYTEDVALSISSINTAWGWIFSIYYYFLVFKNNYVGQIVSEAFTVSNGVRQGDVLSPYLFSVYMDDLSDKLNNTDAGCCIGNLTLNHIIYADGLCCFAANAGGLQDLLDVCSNYAKLHDIVFNCKKTVGMIFSSKNMYTFMLCNMNTDGQKIKFVNNVVYLGAK